MPGMAVTTMVLSTAAMKVAIMHAERTSLRRMGRPPSGRERRAPAAQDACGWLLASAAAGDMGGFRSHAAVRRGPGRMAFCISGFFAGASAHGGWLALRKEKPDSHAWRLRG